VLWDDTDAALHQMASQLAGLPPIMTAIEKSKRRAAALDCSSVGPDIRAHVDPFDTGSLKKLVDH